MTIKSFTFNPFQTNCFICHENGEAVIVDPSCAHADEVQQVLKYIESESLEVKHLLLTHGHIDHIFGCKAMVEAFGMKFKMHASDAPLLEEAPAHARMFGTTIDAPPAPETFLQEGDTVEFGDTIWSILHTPGHSPGSICFVDEMNGYVIAGDVLFYNSIGRTDLWQGSLPTLMRSIFQKLMTMEDDVQVYPGHGPATTIGRERAFNPFLIEYGDASAE